MSDEKESFLRFSLEESVWFQKGQEVAELLTISLDPNITIEEKDQYVTIEGDLQLTGEYKRHDEEDSEDEVALSPKFVHSTSLRDDGITEFAHAFPVDITIPRNRIQSIYEVDVEIESFDCVFPERSFMKLTADLTITGLKEDEEEIRLNEVENEQEEFRDEQEESVEVPVDIAEDEFEPFLVEARKQDDESVDAPFFENERIPVLQQPKHELPDISYSAQRNQETEEEEVYGNRRKHQQNQIELEYESPSFVESESSSPEEILNKKKKKKKKISMKQGISITEFLARKEEQDDVAKLKVCLVQEGDTLDSLAQRYEVSTQQIVKVNGLDITQEIYGGQVLYIPATIAYRP